MNKSIVRYVKSLYEKNSILWVIACGIVSRITSKITGNTIIENSLIQNSTVSAGGKSNTIKISGGVIRNSRIIINGSNSSVTIDENCVMNHTDIILYGDNAHCIIGKNVTFNSFKTAETGINVSQNTTLSIGDDSLFSNSIGIYTTDFHKIMNSDGIQINVDKSIQIGKKVWIGMRALILKGSKIPDGCVIGAGSLVAGAIKEKKSVVGGNPIRILKYNISWEK